jgi:hypothetical protein
MKFKIRAFVFVALIATTAVNAQVATQLTSHDVADLKAICASLVGKSALDISTAAGERGILGPYLEWFQGDANPGRMIVRCADVCTGTLRLRGGADVEFAWPNQSKRLSELHVKSTRLRIHRRTVYVAQR